MDATENNALLKLHFRSQLFNFLNKILKIKISKHTL